MRVKEMVERRGRERKKKKWGKNDKRGQRKRKKRRGRDRNAGRGDLNGFRNLVSSAE